MRQNSEIALRRSGLSEMGMSPGFSTYFQGWLVSVLAHFALTSFYGHFSDGLLLQRPKEGIGKRRQSAEIIYQQIWVGKVIDLSLNPSTLRQDWEHFGNNLVTFLSLFENVTGLGTFCNILVTFQSLFENWSWSCHKLFLNYRMVPLKEKCEHWYYAICTELENKYLLFTYPAGLIYC